MIRWTTSGAVPSPSTIQIRVQRRYPGRIRAGAPAPTRSMSADEVLDNVRHFTVGQRTPRGRPCTALVLSGVGVASREDTAPTMDEARAEGVDHVVLHASIEDLDSLDVDRYLDRVDVLVVPVRHEHLAAASRAIARATGAGLDVAANTVLTADTLPRLRDIGLALSERRPRTMTFTFPFPLGDDETRAVPSPARARAALAQVLPLLDRAGVPVTIKGMAACHLGEEAWRLRRSANRWYVDADHQRDEALLFFSEVVAFYKGEPCRFCEAEPLCDGFFAEWLRRPGVEPLRSLDALPSRRGPGY